MVLERDFQSRFIGRVKTMFPGCVVLKNDSGYQQGIPDWTILYRNKWAVLEIKPKRPTSSRDYRPNQEWFLEQFDEMSFAACVYPENEEDVLHELQQAFRVRRQTRVPQRQ